MTPKEALLNIVTLMRDEYKFPFNLTIEYKLLKQAITELEELKRDVKRYFEIYNSELKQGEWWNEYTALKEKLSEVGKEE